MKTLYAILIVTGLIVVGLYGWGLMVGGNTGYNAISGNSYSIGSCSGSWSSDAYTGESPYCSNGTTCEITPDKERHNKLVDVLMCACANAKANNYENSDRNRKIEDLYSMLTTYDLSTKKICEQPRVSKIYY